VANVIRDENGVAPRILEQDEEILSSGSSGILKLLPDKHHVPKGTFAQNRKENPATC
jgi:hypothetical protein